jgi:hypothetical protein
MHIQNYHFMKSIVFSVLLLISCNFAHGQTLDRSVVSNAGGSQSKSNIQIEFTVGEFAVFTHTSSSAVLTEGFNQGYIQKDTQGGSIKPHLVNLDIRVFPNPASDVLVVENNEDNEVEFQVFDVIGKPLSDVQTVRSHAIKPVKIRSLPSGIYLIQMKDEKQNISTYRWIKQ